MAEGNTVRIHSLVGRPELNGRDGRVISALSEPNGRIGVLIDGEQKPMALKPSNLEAAPPVVRGQIDPLSDPATGRLGPLGAIDNCTDLANKLWVRLTGQPQVGWRDATSIPATGLFECLHAQRPAANTRAVCYLFVGSIGHDCLLELATDGATGQLRARPFSAWVCEGGEGATNDGIKSVLGDRRRVQTRVGCRGYTANEWASDSSRCR